MRHGRRGEDLIVTVPPGTVVLDDQGTLIADLVEHGQRAVVLKGGRGGQGNAALVTHRNRAPTFCEQGEYGRRDSFTFEMKLVADAALIGFPNAGKSTLISRVSAARPKIADYPFTTLEPNLGVVVVDNREFVLADIPGLIEGAAEGKGLGHDFLRHSERAKALVVLLDPSPLQALPPERQYEVLRRELRSHNPELADRPRVVAVTKADLGITDSISDALRQAVPDVMTVSSVTGVGIEQLLHRIADVVDLADREMTRGEGFVLHRPLSPAYSVRRVDDTWVVEGRAAERAVAFNDLTLPEAAGLAAHRLTRMGVDGALRRAGAREGDEVRIGDHVFEFWESEDD